MDLNHIVPAFVRRSSGRLRNERLITLTRLAAIISFIFMIVPVTDLIVSGWFTDDTGKFPLHENWYLLALRDLHRTLPAIIVPELLITVIIQALYKQRWLPAPHKLLYIISVYAVGALVIVHSLKYLVGRARPNEIMEFGGAMLFSPAWQIANSCQSSCSFPSGEAASAMAMLSVPLILGGVYRVRFLVLTAVLVLVFSLNRIVMGAHFLSDVLLSWMFVALTMAGLWPVFQRNSARIDHCVGQIGQSVCKLFHQR
jgi:membrane-associated PAP2 superfamily phosphatase